MSGFGSGSLGRLRPVKGCVDMIYYIPSINTLVSLSSMLGKSTHLQMSTFTILNPPGTAKSTRL